MKFQLAFVAAVFANECPNDKWETDAEGNCVPKAEYFKLSCLADGMDIELDQAVFPDAGSVFLKGADCAASFDWDTQKWTVNTALDGCDTEMSTNADGLAFSNVLRLDAYTAGDMIYTTPSVLINFECTYDTVYEGIEANDVNVIGENIDAESEAGEGKFDFTLTQYMDADRQNPASADDETELGAILYFQLSMNNPIENLDFVIDSCVVKDTNLEEEYNIITKQCGDTFLEYTSSEVKADNVQSAINFSYQGFKFVASVDDETAVNMKLECSVIVCDGSDQDSACNTGCTTGDS